MSINLNEITYERKSNVSENFKKCAKENIRELDGFVEMLVNGSYINAMPNNPLIDIISISGTNMVDMCVPEYVADNDSIYYKYASLEEDYFKLDGSFILPNRNNNKYTGYIGGIGSDTITISEEYDRAPLGQKKAKNITIYFDEEYPIEMYVTLKCVYEDSNMNNYWASSTRGIINNTKKIITTENFVDESIVHNNVVYNLKGICKITVYITQWSNNNHRVRIRQINLGETLLFENSDLIEININEQISLDNLDLPNNDCSITINNDDEKFNILDANSVLNRINKSSSIKPYVAIKVDGANEYVSLGSYKYSSYVDNNNLDITFNGIGSVENLSNQFAYISSVQTDTVQQCAIFLFNSSSYYNEVSYNKSVNLGNTNFENRREQAQALAMFSNSFVKQYRNFSYYTGDNYIGLSTIKSEYSDIIELSQQLEYPKIKKIDKIKEIQFHSKQTGQLNNDEVVLYEDELAGTYQFSYYEILAYVHSDTPILDSSIKVYVDDALYSEYYIVKKSSYNIQIDIRVSDEELHKIKVVGKNYQLADNIVAITNDSIEDGSSLEINNIYINKTYDRVRVSKYYFNNIGNKYEYEFEVEILGDPSIEVGDTILLETKNGYIFGIIENIQSKYNGGFTSQIKGVGSIVLQ